MKITIKKINDTTVALTRIEYYTQQISEILVCPENGDYWVTATTDGNDWGIYRTFKTEKQALAEMDKLIEFLENNGSTELGPEEL